MLTCFFIAVAKNCRCDSLSEIELCTEKLRNIPACLSYMQTVPADILEHDAELLAGERKLGNLKKCVWMEWGRSASSAQRRVFATSALIFPEEKRLPSKWPLLCCWECMHSLVKERCYTKAHDVLLEVWKAEYGMPKKKLAKGKGVSQSRETVSDSNNKADEDFKDEELPFDGKETTQNWGQLCSLIYQTGADFVVAVIDLITGTVADCMGVPTNTTFWASQALLKKLGMSLNIKDMVSKNECMMRVSPQVSNL